MRLKTVCDIRRGKVLGRSWGRDRKGQGCGTRSVCNTLSEKIVCYATEHYISRTVMSAFSEGCKGQILPPLRLYEGTAALYGILRGCQEVIKQCEQIGNSYIALDHGYIGHDHFGGYYRVSRNARQASVRGTGNYPSDRWELLHRELRPWKRTGRNVLIIPLTGATSDFYGFDGDKWLDNVVDRTKRHTDRNIVIRPKPKPGQGTPIDKDLQDAHCIITHSSNVAVDALLMGVPVLTLGESSANGISWSFENIESPVWPDREPWLFELCYRQFTLNELRRGEIDYETCVYRV